MSDTKRRPVTETAHILFLDIVGFSRLPMEMQVARVAELHGVVRESAEFQHADKDSNLLVRDTGDGLTLVFFRDPIAPVQCAVEIAHSLLDRPHLPVRMGIHSGPISRVRDAQDNENVIGDGINMAQRVMDCGDAGHIFLSQRTADDLRLFAEWEPHLLDAGEFIVKHEVRLHLYNLHTGIVGNPAPPAKSPAPIIANAPAAKDAQNESIQNLKSEIQNSLPREPVGGAVPLASRFYIERPTDAEFMAAIARRDSIVLVKGARQMGKTSLLARGLQAAREDGAKVVFTDFQTLNEKKHLASADSLLFVLATMIAAKLGLAVKIRDFWDEELGANMNMELFLETEVFPAIPEPLVWGLDEVDRLFACDFGGEIFGLFRSWHNRRALEPDGPWSRFTLAIAYATEAHLFITDLNQSPFNVGTHLSVEDFTRAQVEELNCRYDSPFPDADSLGRLYALVSGHPYLVRRSLDAMSQHQLEMAELEAQAAEDEGLFGDHLRRLFASLTRDPETAEAMRGVLRGEGCPTAEIFYRLRSAGVVVGDSARNSRLRCELYRLYLLRHLI